MKKYFRNWFLTFYVMNNGFIKCSGICYLLISIFLLSSLEADAQCFSGVANRTSSSAGDWSTGGGGGNWGGFTSPGCNISINAYKVEVQHNMTVFSATCPTLTMSGETAALKVVNNSTLTVQGDFNSAGEGVCIFIETGSTLLIQGDFILSAESVDLIIEGTMIVQGDFIVANESASINVEGNLVIAGELNCSGACEPGSTSFSGGGTITAGGGCTGDFGGECQTALPIVLLYFNVAQQESNVLVTWATSIEKDFDKFMIQRSNNGLHFEDLEMIPGQGRDLFKIETKYSYVDKAPIIGVNYYRLKALDLNGSFQYFKTIVVKIDAPKSIVVYPNPAKGHEISFRTNFTADDQYDRVLIFDALGNEVLNRPATSYNNSIQPERPLRAGVYILKYSSKDFQSVTRLVVKD